jgi:hypothetical protein
MIDDGPTNALAVSWGFDPRGAQWQERVLANATEISADVEELASGWHTLRLVAVDAGVVVDNIVLDFGGLHPSYDGAAETRVPVHAFELNDGSR